MYNLYAPLVRSERVGTAMRKAFEKSNYVVYKATGGRIWNRMGSAQIILVTTTGRRTGRQKEFPLLSVPSNGGWVIIGSNAGRPTDPAWVANIRAIPDVSITVKTTSSLVRAREVVDKQEYGAHFAAMVEAYRNYQDYTLHTSRRMPMFLLEPRP
jgi:deazaflavin-dependent oxidoreductase (nitroreductase family)